MLTVSHPSPMIGLFSEPPRRIVVMGLGKSGLSCVRHLRALGHEVVVTDDRSNPPDLARCRTLFPEVKIALGGYDPSVLAWAEGVVVSPGISQHHPDCLAVQASGRPVVGDVELFMQAVQAPLILVTGSNGKSSVVTLLGQVLQRSGFRVAVGGNLGTPALDLLHCAQDVDYFVLELSSYQLARSYSQCAHVAVLLNISVDHLDWHADFEHYVAAKRAIFDRCEFAIYHRDCQQYLEHLACQNIVTFGDDAPSINHFGVSQTESDLSIYHGARTVLSASDMKRAWPHEIQNAMAVFAVAQCLGIDEAIVLAAIQRFDGLPHRCQRVTQCGQGVVWYNDSKATNVASAIAAIRALSTTTRGRCLVLMGGIHKPEDHYARLGQVLMHCTQGVVIYGQDRQFLRQQIAVTEGYVDVVVTLNQAVASARKWAKAGDTVVLSPACSSFDQFEHFADRGERFVEMVLEPV